MLTKKISQFAGKLIPGTFKKASSKISPRFGGLLAVFGKWKVTTKGILFERTAFAECDYFLDNRTLSDLVFLKSELDRLSSSGWLEEIDCYQFLSAWFHKLSFQGQESKGHVATKLAELQSHLVDKFSLVS
jgi:hypothetical protein